jgi:hypothetical protein
LLNQQSVKTVSFSISAPIRRQCKIATQFVRVRLGWLPGFLLPQLGRLAIIQIPKRLMALFCYVAVIANRLLSLFKVGFGIWGGLLFMSNVCFGLIALITLFAGDCY